MRFDFRMKVKDLLHAVGKKCGIDPSLIDRMDLENVVERVIAISVRKFVHNRIAFPETCLAYTGQEFTIKDLLAKFSPRIR